MPLQNIIEFMIFTIVNRLTSHNCMNNVIMLIIHLIEKIFYRMIWNFIKHRTQIFIESDFQQRRIINRLFVICKSCINMFPAVINNSMTYIYFEMNRMLLKKMFFNNYWIGTINSITFSLYKNFIVYLLDFILSFIVNRRFFSHISLLFLSLKRFISVLLLFKKKNFK